MMASSARPHRDTTPYWASSIATLTLLGDRPDLATIASKFGPTRCQATTPYNPLYCRCLTRRLVNTGSLPAVEASRMPVLTIVGPAPQRNSAGAFAFRTRSVQQGRLQRSSLFLVHALLRRLLLLQPQFTTETLDDEYKYSLPRRGSPFKGLGTRCAPRLPEKVVRILLEFISPGHVVRVLVGDNTEPAGRGNGEQSGSHRAS